MGTVRLIRDNSKQSTRRIKASSSSQCALQPQDDNNQEVDEIQEDPDEEDTQQVPSPASSSKENSNNNNRTTPVTTSEEATTTQVTTTNETNGNDKPAVGSAEWHRIRRENHKQVERRRRETINEGINEIARMVPGCEKNKGQILHRAALYIQQLKEAESATLEKWTLEKLLTDQAMNELNRQVDGLKSELEQARQEIDHLKRQLGDKASTPPNKRARLNKEEKE